MEVICFLEWAGKQEFFKKEDKSSWEESDARSEGYVK